MADLSFSINEDFIKSLGSLAQVDRYAETMINEALPIVKRTLEKNLLNHKRTGSLQKSLKMNQGKKASKGGYYGDVCPQGVDKRGERNGEKAVFLEYGTSKQLGTGVFAASVKECEDDVIAKMQEVFEREALKDL